VVTVIFGLEPTTGFPSRSPNFEKLLPLVGDLLFAIQRIGEQWCTGYAFWSMSLSERATTLSVYRVISLLATTSRIYGAVKRVRLDRET
jgi:hypothetical protein